MGEKKKKSSRYIRHNNIPYVIKTAANLLHDIADAKLISELGNQIVLPQRDPTLWVEPRYRHVHLTMYEVRTDFGFLGTLPFGTYVANSAEAFYKSGLIDFMREGGTWEAWNEDRLEKKRESIAAEYAKFAPPVEDDISDAREERASRYLYRTRNFDPVGMDMPDEAPPPAIVPWDALSWDVPF